MADVSENDYELIETWLDGELSDADALVLRRRIAAEPALAEALEAEQGRRARRAQAFAAMEGSPAHADEVFGQLEESMTLSDLRTHRWSTFRRYAAMAACLVVGVGIGRLLLPPTTPATMPPGGSPIASVNAPAAGAAAYRVLLADPSGKVVEVHPFNTADGAIRFAGDLRERVTPRSDSPNDGPVMLVEDRF